MKYELRDMNFLDKLQPQLAIDLTSDQIKIFILGQEELVSLPSCVAIDKKDQQVLKIGLAAQAMLGRLDQEIKINNFIKYGEIRNIDLAKVFFKFLFAQNLPKFSLLKPVVLVSTPAGLSKAKKKITADLFYALGASEVILVAAPLSAAIGAGVPIADSSGSFILQIEKDYAEMAAIALAKIVNFQHTKYFFQNLNLFDLYLEKIEDLMFSLPAGLSIDFLDKGLLITGSLANQDNLEDFLSENLKVPVSTVESPSEQVIWGLKEILVNLKLFKASLAYQKL